MWPPVTCALQANPPCSSTVTQSTLYTAWLVSAPQHLVDMEGYDPEEQSWVPSAFILDPDVIPDFHRSQLNKPK